MHFILDHFNEDVEREGILRGFDFKSDPASLGMPAGNKSGEEKKNMKSKRNELNCWNLSD